MNITLSYSELNELIRQAAKEGAKQTVYELGLVKTTYSRAEIEKLYGTAAFHKSKQFVKWQKKGNSKTSPVICQKAEFDQYVKKFDIELKPVKQ